MSTCRWAGPAGVEQRHQAAVDRDRRQVGGGALLGAEAGGGSERVGLESRGAQVALVDPPGVGEVDPRDAERGGGLDDAAQHLGPRDRENEVDRQRDGRRLGQLEPEGDRDA